MTTRASPSLCERYQQATNYTPASVQGHPGLDFSRQPSAFKTWHQARRVVLPRDPGEPDGTTALDLPRLGRLLHHTYGVTLVREVPGMSMHYRAAPSAGGLYPAELYVAIRGVEGAPDGLFAYDAREHALVVCWEGDFTADLTHAAFHHPAMSDARIILIATGVFQRSAWRYGDRAYRRVLLDTGHVLGNAVVAAEAEGLSIVPLTDFHDEPLENMLLLDPASEGVLALGVVREGPSGDLLAPALRSPTVREAAEPDDGAWIAPVHAAGRMAAAEPAEAPFDPAPLPAPAGPAVALVGPDTDVDATTALQTIRRRRSTRMFAPAPVALEDLGRVLYAGYPGDATRMAVDVLETWVVTAGVHGLPDGVHKYEPDPHTLTPIRFGNPRDALHRCCLWQELGRDCSFAVIHTVDLGAAVARYGERIYRTVHLDAGLIGQRLNLAALHARLGASGIAGFFDEHLAQLLHGSSERAIVYVTAIGVPA